MTTKTNVLVNDSITNNKKVTILSIGGGMRRDVHSA